MRRAKVDTTQSEIVQALRDCGCLVQSLATVGKGVPDLLVCTPGDPWTIALVECKTGAGKLRPDQVKFQADGWPVTVLRSAEEAEAWVQGE